MGKTPESFGDLRMEPVHFETTSDEPIRQKRIRLPYKRIRERKQYIQDLMDKGIIRRSTPSHRSNAFFITQGDKTRMVLDAREVNKKLREIAIPIPRTQHMMWKIASQELFIVIDGKSAFNQIPIDEESARLTAFQMDGKLYE